ncbi:exonuclease sbcCD subunit D, partial [Pseudomonas sp. GW456-E7]
TIVDAKPGEEASWREVLLSSGKPLVKWKAANGLSEVYSWLDEGRDQNAWIDLEIRVSDQLSLEEIHRLRKAHPGFI